MIQRLTASLITLWLAVTLTFVLLRLVPGDAIAAQFEGHANLQAAQLKREELGLDQPIPVQYVNYWLGLARGDLGVSLTTGLPVTEMLALRWPVTLGLTVGGMLFAIVIGLSTGITIGWRQSWLSRLAAFFTALTLSVPAYWTATLAFLLFGSSQSALPALILGLHSGGAIGQIFGGTLRDVAQADYIRVAQAKGLPRWVIIARHAVRPALAPVVMVMALQAGYLMSGAILTEMIFQRYGVGMMLRDAVLGQDYPVVQGIVVLLTGIYVALTFAAEIGVWWLDPRVRDV